VIAAKLASADELERTSRVVRRGRQNRTAAHFDLQRVAFARIAYLFRPDDAVEWDLETESAVRKHAQAAQTLRDYRVWLEPRIANGIDAAELRAAAKPWAQEHGLKLPAFFQPVRCALAGVIHGADLFDVMALLGPRAVLRRLEVGAQRLGG
jgi:glutamyl/glutaminyl-tRNA synthetase